MTKPKSIALERRVQCYPSPHYHILVNGYAIEYDLSKSNVICLGIKLFFDSLPAHERERLIKSGKKIKKVL